MLIEKATIWEKCKHWWKDNRWKNVA